MGRYFLKACLTFSLASFKVAFGLIGLASGFEGLVVGLPCRGLP